jgi:glycerate kinase
MKILIAPDSFKECLSAREVAAVMAAAAREHWPGAEVVEMPLADGGEGTLDALAGPLKARLEPVQVHDPLGRKVTAQLGLVGEMALVEVAQACGLQLLKPAERNPLKASSYGVGELLLAAYEKGCRHFIVGLGGSAICDGGKGMLEVPGLKSIKDISVELLCDVDAPFIGPKGAARVFAPQKGASPEDVEVLEGRMTEWARQMEAETGVDVTDLPGAGAAGGLGGAFMAYWGARRVSGIDRILELVGFEKEAQGADLILTGEGKSDAQTLMGKVPQGVLQNAKGTPVALLSGCIQNRTELLSAGFSQIVEVSPRSLPLALALQPNEVKRNILRAVKDL